MKSIIKITISAALLISLITFFGCRDGAPGPAGAAGKTGANAPGYDEAVKNGNVVYYLDGISPDGLAFKDTIDFKYSSSDLWGSSRYADGDNETDYELVRYRALNAYNDDNIDAWLRANVEEGDTTFMFEFDLRAHIVTSDNNYFVIDDEYYEEVEASNTNGASFEGFKDDQTKGTLYYRFNFVVPGESNSTGHDLNVSGVANCSVYKPLGGG